MEAEVTFTGGQPNVDIYVPCTLRLYRDGSAYYEPHWMVPIGLDGYAPPRRIVDIQPGD